jgi:hypothetical protein
MPDAIEIEVVDALGRTVTAHGVAVAQFSHLGYPSMLVQQGMVRWEYDDSIVYAEDQDVWDPVQWRALRRR